MRLLVTGISGFLGWNLAREAVGRAEVEVFASSGSHDPPEGVLSRQVDLESPRSIHEVLTWSQPDAIIHAAAMSRPADCDRLPGHARQINEHAVETIIRTIDPARTSFLLCSTDLVFDGLEAPYEESAEPKPHGIYALTKRAAEMAVLSFAGNGAVVRLSLLYGQGPANSPSFLGWLDRGLRSGQPLDMFSDEIRTPLSGEEAARALLDLAMNRADGVFHLGGPQRISRYDFAHMYARVFGLDKSHIRPASQLDFPTGVYRPPDVSLLCERARRQIGFAPMAPEKALLRLREQCENH